MIFVIFLAFELLAAISTCFLRTFLLAAAFPFLVFFQFPITAERLVTILARVLTRCPFFL